MSDYDFSKLKPNVRHFEILDLSSYLNEKKKGFVGISWNFSSLTVPQKISYDYFNDFLNKIKDPNQRKIVESSFFTNNSKQGYWVKDDIRWDYKKMEELTKILTQYGFKLEREPYQQQNLQVQVTDLGVTTRYAYNKILVWVNSLSTGQPVNNAKVILKDEKFNSKKKEAYTDSNGLAEIALKENEFVSCFYDRKNYEEKPRIYVEKDQDKVDFIPNYSHDNYHFGINQVENPVNIERIKPQTFIFTDRGVYRPGETVTYRGIDRDLKLGEYSVYQGSFNLQVGVRENNSKTIYQTDAKTSESGGFYGSFKLPDNLDPGFYTIKYRRGNNYEEDVDFQVANFRRLNFQVKIDKPKIENYFTGDSLSFTVKASYLSGGAMSGAKCDYYWMASSFQFMPKGDNWKGFKFGPVKFEGNNPLGEGKGVLNQDGELSIKQKTDSNSQNGETYNYTLYAKVEDIDRQVIQGMQSAIVNPASFYIGARFASGKEGWWSPFVKKGEKVEAEAAFVNPDGSLYKPKEQKNIKIKLYKIEWKIAQQQGVSERINTRYEQVEELEKENSIAVKESFTKFQY